MSMKGDVTIGSAGSRGVTLAYPFTAMRRSMRATKEETRSTLRVHDALVYPITNAMLGTPSSIMPL
jgi:hypothetical protein